jgi:hypothetical protein
MVRSGNDRAIDSALSIFVVAVVLGLVAAIGATAGEASIWWHIRHQGGTSASVAVRSLMWSWTTGFATASSWGIVVGLWRLSKRRQATPPRHPGRTSAASGG